MDKQELLTKSQELFKNVNLGQPGVVSSGQIRTMTDSKLIEQVQNGLVLPPNYNSANALTEAFLRLENVKNRNGVPATKCCTPASIMQSMMDMAVQGLSPNKNQCYFIVYGNHLEMKRSYFGTIAILKRFNIISEDPIVQIVHEGDEFEIGSDEMFRTIVTKFTPMAGSLDKPIKYAFAVLVTTDGVKHYTIMTKKDIDASWSQSRTHAVQQKFSDEMAKRTVLNRAAKMYINTADDVASLDETIDDTSSNEQNDDDDRRDVTPDSQDDATQTIIDTIGKEKGNKDDKSTDEKQTGSGNHADSSEGEEYPVVDGQTDLFEEGTVKPKAYADAK